MRNLTLVLTIALLVVGVSTLARGEGEADQVETLQKQVEALELQVAYLEAREADLTKYVLANGERGAALERMVQQMLVQGYTKKAIPPQSRETFMAGMRALGASLQADLPVVTDGQLVLQKAAAAAKKKSD